MVTSPHRLPRVSRMVRRTVLAVVMSSALALSLAGCGGDGGNGGGSGNGDLLVIGTDAEPTTLNPLLRQGPDSDLATWSVYEGLVKFSPGGELVPELAASLPVRQPDGTTWRYELREDVTFSDGEPFNAEAVKAFIDALLAPDVSATSAVFSELADLTGATVVDDYTVDLTTSVNDPFFDLKSSFLRIAPPKALASGDIDTKPVGTGPYLFERWDQGQSIELKANPDYWGDKPAYDRASIRFIPDAQTRLDALNSGEIDMATSISAENADLVPQKIESTNVLKVQLLRLNLSEPPLDDENFRLAMNYAINRDVIQENLYGGHYEIAPCQAVSSASHGFNPDLEAFPYDPDKARELLARVNIPAGFKLTVTGRTPPVAPGDQEMLQSVVSDLNAVGIDAEVKFDSDTEYSDHVNAAAGDGTVNPGIPQAFLLAPDNGWNNSIRWVNNYVNPLGRVSALGDAEPDLVPIVKTANTDPDAATREDALEQIAAETCNRADFIYLLGYPDIWGAGNDIDYLPGLGQIKNLEIGRIKPGN